MSYQVLARKWRPQNFDDVYGQAHVTTPLRNAIRSNRVPHAILLTGPRGTGKTTLARILARCMNCDKGPTDTPCGECVSCNEIAAGNSTDVREVDAASRTSVDDIRELIEAIRYAPSPGKHRIFVVDEVHMLSTAAFNALLKTLEEPPPRSLFVFATTNPEKIPFTVISRCQRHDLRRIAVREIVMSLSTIAKSESVTVSERSLLAIAREADGSLRDAQTLLDQIIAHGDSEIDDEQVADILDLVDRRLLFDIAEACVKGEPTAAIEACARIGKAGVDAKRLGGNLLELLRDLVVLRIAPDANQLVEGGEEEIAELRALAAQSDELRLRRMFRALLKEQEDLAWAPQPFAVLEMAVVRLATMAAGDDVSALLARLDALERGMRGGAGSGGSDTKTPSGRKTRSTPRAPAVPDPPAKKTKSPDETAAAPPPTGGSLEAHPAVVIDRLRGFLRSDHPGLYAALDGARLVASDDSHLRVSVPEAFAAQRLRGRIETLETVCAEFFGRPTRFEIESEESATGSDEAQARGGPEPLTNEAKRQLRQRALNHPAISRAIEILDGEITEIRPTDSAR